MYLEGGCEGGLYLEGLFLGLEHVHLYLLQPEHHSPVTHLDPLGHPPCVPAFMPRHSSGGYPLQQYCALDEDDVGIASVEVECPSSVSVDVLSSS